MSFKLERYKDKFQISLLHSVFHARVYLRRAQLMLLSVSLSFGVSGDYFLSCLP